LLYCSSETNAVLTIENAKAYLDEQGISYVEKIVTSSSEVQQAAQALAAQCDAIYVPIDSTVQTAMDQVASVATEAGIPVYGSSLVMVQSGALATVAVSDTEIGAMSAKQADEYFQGTPISEIPAVTLDSFTMIINENTAAALGVTVPDDENVTVISVVE
jgi:putative ABC transport system substrate-binding protein